MFWISNLETNGFSQHSMGFQFEKTLTVDFHISSLSKYFNARRQNKQRLLLQKPAIFVGLQNYLEIK